MIFNPEKFQAIVVTKNVEMKDSYSLNIDDLIINSENSVKPLGIETDNKLAFEQDFSTICNKSNNQLKVIGRIQNFMGFKKKEVLLNSFLYSNFNYCPLVWLFCSSKSLCKIEKKKIQERVPRLLHSNFASDYVELLKNHVKSQWK